jgi:hypothetical protein
VHEEHVVLELAGGLMQLFELLSKYRPALQGAQLSMEV